MQVLVQQVVPDGTVAVARGVCLEDGAHVVFAGDWRPMAEIRFALDAGEEVTAEVPDYAVLTKLSD